MTTISQDRRLESNFNIERGIRLIIADLKASEQWRKLKRQHLQPDLQHGLFIDCLGVTEDPDASGTIPYEQFVEALREDPGQVTVTSEPYWAYGARLSAPGYLDCTDWAAHPTLREAIEDLLHYAGDEEE